MATVSLDSKNKLAGKLDLILDYIFTTLKNCMKLKKIKACIFVHYNTGNILPYYVQIYIDELSLYFDKIIILTNNSEISSNILKANSNITFEYFENRGYDFGMIYRYISKQNLDNYSELAIINDSNIILNKLGKVFLEGRNSNSDFWGIIDSNEKPWFSTHENNYHIQSHFLVLNEKAIKILPAFFDTLDIDKIMGEPNLKTLRRFVIDQWEIGFSQYLLKHGLKMFSFIQNESLKQKLKTKRHNLLFSHYFELAAEGYPLLKRKVILKHKEKRMFQKSISINCKMAGFVNKEWDSKKLFEDLDIC